MNFQSKNLIKKLKPNALSEIRKAFGFNSLNER